MSCLVECQGNGDIAWIHLHSFVYLLQTGYVADLSLNVALSMGEKREHKEIDSQEPMESDYGTLELTILNPYFLWQWGAMERF